MVTLSKKPAKSTIVGCSNGDILDGYYICPSGFATRSLSREGTEVVMPFSATLKNFYVQLEAAPGAGKSWVLTIVKNGVDTALVVTISDTATSGSDTTHSASVSAGDRISMRTDKVNAPSNMWAGWGLQIA